MKLIIQSLIFYLFFATSCGVEDLKFNKEGWQEQNDGFYDNREKMIKDLMANYLHKGMTYAELSNLMGQPENYANLKPNVIAYEIMVDYKWNIDPMEGKILYIELSEDSIVTNYRLEHWKK